MSGEEVDAPHAMPSGIVLHEKSRVLELTWGGGADAVAAGNERPLGDVRIVRIPTAALRAACPCSRCESARIEARAVAPSDDAATITGIEMVGAYALHVSFADGHDRGIYPWAYLGGLGAAASD